MVKVKFASKVPAQFLGKHRADLVRNVIVRTVNNKVNVKIRIEWCVGVPDTLIEMTHRKQIHMSKLNSIS